MTQRIEGNAQNSIHIAEADGVKNVQLIGIAHNVAETPRSIRQIIGKAIVAMSSYRGADQLIFLGSLDKIPHAHLARGKPSEKGYARISVRNPSTRRFRGYEWRHPSRLAKQHFCPQFGMVG